MVSGSIISFGVLLLSTQNLIAQDVLCKKGRQDFDITLNSGDKFAFDTKIFYKAKQICVANYKLGACSGASVSCSTFDLNSNKECHWGDVFYITDFYKDKRYCLTTGPDDYRPDGDFKIEFISNYRYAGEGLKCSVACRDGRDVKKTKKERSGTKIRKRNKKRKTGKKSGKKLGKKSGKKLGKKSGKKLGKKSGKKFGKKSGKKNKSASR